MENASDVGLIIQKQLAEMQPEERIAYLLLARFCEEYDNAYGTPYWPGREALRRPREHECYAAFVSLAGYLRARGVAIGNRELPWQGYVRFAIQSFARSGMLPCPTQLKNPVLLRRYLELTPVTEDVQRVRVDYAKIVSPCFRTPEALRLLGLA